MSTTETTKTVLVVGASRGLGLALAAEYARRGWHVIGTVRGSARTALHDLADASGGRIVVETVDIDVPEAVTALHARLSGTTPTCCSSTPGSPTATSRPSPSPPRTSSRSWSPTR